VGGILKWMRGLSKDWKKEQGHIEGKGKRKLCEVTEDVLLRTWGGS